MKSSRFNRRGLALDTDYGHLRGRLDTEMLLEDLGIDFAYMLREHQFQCHCPDLYGNHKNGDANPSFGFNDEKLSYNCFTCGGGNIIDLVQLMKPEFKNDAAGTIQYLEKFADFSVGENVQAKINAILHPEEKTEEIMPDYPKENLFQYRKIHPYLYERGLSKDVIVEMQIGFDESHCAIVFPHFFMGKLVGVQRRHLAMSGDKYICDYCEKDQLSANREMMKTKKVGKYVNTSRFPRSNTLYGYDQMKEHLKEENGSSVIVVESPMSALKLKSLGFQRVVATFGQFSKEQGMLLIAIPTVYFWADNDAAGKSNTDRCVDFLSRYTDLKLVPVLPEEKGDPGDLDTAEEVKNYLSQAYPAALFPLYAKEKLPTLSDLSER